MRAAVAAATLALGRAPVVDKWTFSTNGIATCGMFGIPTVGFGPANEVHAHTPEDQCPVEHLTLAARFYAMFAGEYLKAGPGSRLGIGAGTLAACGWARGTQRLARASTDRQRSTDEDCRLTMLSD